MPASLNLDEQKLVRILVNEPELHETMEQPETDQAKHLRWILVRKAQCGHIAPDGPFYFTLGGKVTCCDTLNPATNARSYTLERIVKLPLQHHSTQAAILPPNTQTSEES